MAAARLTPSTIRPLVQRQFKAALSTKDLVFAPSTVERVTDAGIHFDILHAPAFAIKPGPPPSTAAPAAPAAAPAAPAGPPKRFNPFLPPQPELVVGDIENFNVILNKFTVCENHILLTTKDFKQQSCVLQPSEMAALWDAMQGFGDDAFAFHNNGLASGASWVRRAKVHVRETLLTSVPSSPSIVPTYVPYASSVPHRHLQVLPYKMPLSPIIESHIASTRIPHFTPFQLPQLPFHHVLASIPPNPSTQEIHDCYLQIMHLALGEDGVAKLNSVDPLFEDGFVEQAPGSNLMMTPKWLFVVPRKEPRPGIHIHSMGLSGLLVATTQEEIEFLKKTGPLTVLKNASLPKRAIVSDGSRL